MTWVTVDARTRGYFDGYGMVVYQCAFGWCDYTTGPHRPGSSRSNEAMRQHDAAKHPVNREPEPEELEDAEELVQYLEDGA